MSAYLPGQGFPAAVPPGRSAPDTSVQASGVSGDRRGTNTPPPSGPESTPVQPTRRRRRVHADVLRELAETLPQRDRAVLDRIAEHRYLTTHQLQAFVFTNLGTDASAARTTRRVLQRLERTALIRRLAQRIGGVRAGSAAKTWQLAPAGARLLRDDGTTYRTHEPSPRFLAHCLAVADVHLGLRQTVTDLGGEAVIATEPASWRRYTGSAGEPRWLQPDLAVTVTMSDFTERWFVEVDLGTESLPTLLRKCSGYEAYRASGIEQHQHRAFPRVLWLFTKPERAERLRASVLRSTRLTPDLYRYDAITEAPTLARELLS